LKRTQKENNRKHNGTGALRGLEHRSRHLRLMLPCTLCRTVYLTLAPPGVSDELAACFRGLFHSLPTFLCLSVLELLLQGNNGLRKRTDLPGGFRSCRLSLPGEPVGFRVQGLQAPAARRLLRLPVRETAPVAPYVWWTLD
jgi:hypothetical protein